MYAHTYKNDKNAHANTCTHTYIHTYIHKYLPLNRRRLEAAKKKTKGKQKKNVKTE